MRNITDQTTDEQILAPVARAKQALLDFATEQVGSNTMEGDRMVSLAQNVKTSEALAHVQITYRDVCRNRPENRINYLMDVACRGADDTWSGRGNDSNRSANDAILGWVRDQSFELRHEGF